VPDSHLLGLLGAHQVLTTGHLARLTGRPERTVQYRLGVLHRAGLVSRHRAGWRSAPARITVALTAFGVTVVGAEASQSWSEDPTGIRTLATLSDFWLGLQDNGSAAGLAHTAAPPDPREGLKASAKQSDRRPPVDDPNQVTFCYAIRTVTGDEGRKVRAAQAKAIKELLRWLNSQRHEMAVRGTRWAEATRLNHDGRARRGRA
jgi:hypothetical protein